jgi:serine/threonine-protein kinase
LRAFHRAHRFCPFDQSPLSDRPVAELVEGRPSSRQSGVYGERYAVRGFVGRGSMTNVLLGEDVFSHLPVAIKILDERHAHDAAIRKRFAQESAAMGRVHHPHVVQALAWGEGADGLPYLVLEHLEGESFADLLQRSPLPPMPISMLVLRQMASALEATHQAGVVHRDIKPANILLIGEPGAPRASKLLDFGLAKVLEGSAVTIAGTAIGTFEYMAPEQVVSEPVDARTDIYGLGVVAYRALTGRLPFPDEGVMLLARQLISPPPRPSELRPGLDPRAERMLLAAIRKDPAQRYPSMDDFLDDLELIAGLREGELLADCLPGGEDVYHPGPGYARSAARYLHGKLGRPLPDYEG